METILIKNILSYTYNPEIISLLNKRFCAVYEGYRFSKAYKERGWDGRYYPVNKTGSFATGMLPEFVKFLKAEGFDLDAEDARESLIYPEYKSLDYLRDYQLEIVRMISRNYIGELPFFRGIVNAATNAGKTYIALGLYDTFNHPKTIFFVHRKTLFDQQVEFFREHLGDQVGLVNSKYKETDKNFIVAMYQSSGNLNFQGIQMMIADESHRCKAAVYKRITAKIRDASVRVCFSGTALTMSDVDKLRVKAISGTQLVKISNKFLQDEGHSSHLTIIMQRVGNKRYCSDFRVAYQEFIVHNVTRNRRIVEFCNAHKEERRTWVVCRYVEHAEHLGLLLAAPVLTGETSTAAKNETIQKFKEGWHRVVVSTMIIDVGMNLPIEAFVLALGGKSEVDIMQLLGRALRITDKFDDTIVLDFYDTGSFVEDHSIARKEIYEREGFDIEIL